MGERPSGSREASDCRLEDDLDAAALH